MALIIAVPLGGLFYVDKTAVKVTAIDTPERFKLTVDNEYLPVEHSITADAAVEILPQVRVSAGLKGSMNEAKVVIEAPRAIKIVRSELLKR